MNLLIDAHIFDEPHQGSRTYLKGLYRELVKLMPHTSFFFVLYNLENLRTEIGDHSNVHFVQLKQRKFLRLLIEVPFLIWKLQIDYAHFQYISPPFKNCKHIVTIHDVLFKDFKKLFPLKYRILNNLLFKISARRADMLLTVSEYSRQRIAKHYKIPVGKIGITPNGISSEFLTGDSRVTCTELKSKYNVDQFILYVSRIEPRKNHLLLLKAFSELRLWERNYKLIFIGKKDFLYGDLDEFLENCPEECRRSTVMLQNIDNSELLTFYKNASLFIYPSLAEGFGIPPIEAISAGTTTLCSNTTAMSDFTFLEADLFDPTNIQELKAKILHKLSHPNDLSRIMKLKQVVEEKYSWDRSAKTFVSILKNNQTKLKVQAIQPGTSDSSENNDSEN